MQIRTNREGNLVFAKTGSYERALGFAMLLTSVIIGYIIINNTQEYNFWVFAAIIFLFLFLAIPGIFFLVFKNFIEINPTAETIVVYRGWLIATPVLEYDFTQVVAVLVANVHKKRKKENISLWQTILRLENGGIMLNFPIPDKEKNLELAENLSKMIEKPIHHVTEREDGDGFSMS